MLVAFSAKGDNAENLFVGSDRLKLIEILGNSRSSCAILMPIKIIKITLIGGRFQAANQSDDQVVMQAAHAYSKEIGSC